MLYTHAKQGCQAWAMRQGRQTVANTGLVNQRRPFPAVCQVLDLQLRSVMRKSAAQISKHGDGRRE